MQGGDPVAEYLKKYGGPKPKQAVPADTIPAVKGDATRVASTDDPVDAYLKKYMTDAAAAQQPSTLGKIGNFLANVVEAPVTSAVNVIAPSKEDAAAVDADPNFQARNIARFGQEIHPRGVTGEERFNAILQTGANMAAPGLAQMGKLGIPAAGALTGAAYDPENRGRGAALGAGFSSLLAAAPVAGGIALDATGTRPRSYTGTPTFANAVADASDAMSPGLATRDITNPPPQNIGRRLLKSGARAVGVESVEQRAVRKISEAMQKDGLSLEQAVSKISAAAGLKPETLMDLAGENVMGLGRGASMVPGSQAKNTIPKTLQERALGQEERLLSDLIETTGQKGRTNIPRTMKALHDEAKSASRPFYEKLEKAGPADMEAAAQYFDRPAFKTAYAHAETVAANKGKTLPKLFEDVKDESGKVVGRKLRPMDFKTVDRVKRALDDVLYDAEKPMPSELASKAGGLSNEGRSAIEEAKNEFLQIADQAFPGYKEARNAYAGPTALNRAVEKGKKILTMTPDEIGEYVGTLSKSELESFQRSGLETFMQRKIENVAPGNDATRQMSKTIDQKRLRYLFPDDESFDRFGQLVQREARMNQTRNFMSGQSKTADKLAELADVMGFGFDVASGNLGSLSRKLLQKGITQRAGGVTSATADEIAKRLTAGASKDGMSFLNLLDEINQYQNQSAPLRRATKAVQGTFGGVVAGKASQP